MSGTNEVNLNKIWEKSIQVWTKSNLNAVNNNLFPITLIKSRDIKNKIKLIKSINDRNSVSFQSFTPDSINLISCKKCKTKFDINDDDLIREHGTKCQYKI